MICNTCDKRDATDKDMVDSEGREVCSFCYQGFEEFTYHVYHIPSDKVVQQTRGFKSRMDFYKMLNDWNRLGKKEWKYWE